MIATMTSGGGLVEDISARNASTISLNTYSNAGIAASEHAIDAGGTGFKT